MHCILVRCQTALIPQRVTLTAVLHQPCWCAQPSLSMMSELLTCAVLRLWLIPSLCVQCVGVVRFPLDRFHISVCVSVCLQWHMFWLPPIVYGLCCRIACVR